MNNKANNNNTNGNNMQQLLLAHFFSTPRASTLSADALVERKAKTSPPRRKRRSKLKSIENGGGLQQTIIDIGQKNIGMEHCIGCGMVYSQENPKDVAQHEHFHNRFTAIRNYRVTLGQIDTWKSQLRHEQVSVPVSGFLFALSATSTATLKRKFEDILNNYVNEELGYSPELPVWNPIGHRYAFVFIADSAGGPRAFPFIAALVLIDEVDEVMVMPMQKQFKDRFLGVDRIWVHSQMRRKGIATFILDAARRILTPASRKEYTRRRVAFSDPTDLGTKFAVNYAHDGDKNNTSSQYIIYTPPMPVRSRVDQLIKKLSNSSSSNADQANK